MTKEFFSIGFISIVVAIENALLAGMILPWATRQHKKRIMIVVGLALTVAQIVLAVGVGQLLTSVTFRLVAVFVPIWMSIRTLVSVSIPTRTLTGSV